MYRRFYFKDKSICFGPNSIFIGKTLEITQFQRFKTTIVQHFNDAFRVIRSISKSKQTLYIDF